jgi:predicted DNA-binding antitoxin AbrB/MazE fold protein
LPKFFVLIVATAEQHVHAREEKMVENPNNEKPSVTLPATVEKIIKKSDAEKAQVRIEGAEPLYRELRIENSLQDENGEKVHLKEGAEVQVTVTADPQSVIPDDSEERDRNKVERSSTKEMT